MEDSCRNIFSERLRYAREKLRKLTQSQLADKARMPSTSISHFENPEGSRKPSFDNLRRLAKALEVTTDYLLGRSNNPIADPANGDKLYRDIKSMTNGDRQFAEEMIKRMIERHKKGTK